MKAIEYSLKAKKQEFNTQKIGNSADAAEFARNFYHEDLIIYESSFIILLNKSNRAIGYSKISQGGVAGTYVDPKIVAKYAIDSLATGIIFVHNHPSGNFKPSSEDIKMSQRLREVLKLIDIQFLDSIIITEESHYSMADENLL